MLTLISLTRCQFCLRHQSVSTGCQYYVNSKVNSKATLFVSNECKMNSCYLSISTSELTQHIVRTSQKRLCVVSFWQLNQILKSLKDVPPQHLGILMDLICPLGSVFLTIVDVRWQQQLLYRSAAESRSCRTVQGCLSAVNHIKSFPSDQEKHKKLPNLQNMKSWLVSQSTANTINSSDSTES